MADIRWTEAQTEAITAAGTNILVSAAAGSGKTAVLVERVIRMITRSEDPVDIDRLLVMTFTRAAAAQMKSKIYTALRTKLLEGPENAWLKQQLMKVPNARICTIDALCAEIVRDHIEDTELDPAYRVADEAEISMLKKDVLSRVMEEMYAEASDEFLRFAEYYVDRNDKKLDEIILTLFQYAQSHPEPEAWLRAAVVPYLRAESMYAVEDGYVYPEGMKDWMPEYAGLIEGKFEEIRCMAEEGLNISCANYGPAAYEDLFREISGFVSGMEGQAFDYRRDSLVQFLEEWRKAPAVSTKNGDVDAALKEKAQKLRGEIKKRLEEIRDDLMYEDLEMIFEQMALCAPVAETISDLVIRFSRAFTEAKRERKIADFSDIAHDALKILIVYTETGEILRDKSGNPVYTETADLMAKSLDEVIVDEYQDTNSLQEYLVNALSAERFGRPDVFMVGDVKQSIYGFRMACPELFTDKMDRYVQTGGALLPGRLIILDRNFRSRKEVLDLTNKVFARTMIRPVGGIDYRNGHGLTYGGGYGELEEADPAFLPELIMIKGSGEQGKYLEAYKIARRIEALTAEEGYDLSDIVILTRSVDNPQLEEVLYQRGIPVIKSSGKGFFDSLEIRLVLDLLKVIDNPFQDIPFTAVLYSPLLSASAEDLARIRLAGDPADSMFVCLKKYLGSGAGGEKFSWFLERLEVWRQKAMYMGVYDFLEYLLRDSQLTYILTAMPQGADRRANIEFLKAKAGTFARGSYTGLFQFIRYIEELKDNDIDFGSMTAASGAKGVRMMTIHKSKGLEFPVVILAVGGKDYNDSDIHFSVVPDRELGLGLEYRVPDTRMIQRTALMQTIRQKQKVRTYAEEMRLLYVAMTRAKEKLIITGTDRFLDTHTKDWERSGGELQPYEILKAGSFLSLLGLSLYPYRDDSGFALTCQEEIDIEEERVEEAEDLYAARQELLRLADTEADTEDIRRALEYEYPYLKATRIQGKITASQLEKKGSKEQKPYTVRYSEEELEQLTGAERGNAYHSFLELMDYQSLSGPDLRGRITEEIKTLENSGKLSPEYAGAIDPDRILSFLDSGIGKRMAEASRRGTLFREKQFVMGSVVDIHREKTETGPEILSDIPDEELLLVQGIIDAYFIEEHTAGEPVIILVDYKTDKNRDEQYYIEKYSPQLAAYADALEKSTGLKTAERIIYSLELGREIRL